MKQPTKAKLDTPFLVETKQPVAQFGLGTMLLIMSIFAVVSVGLFYSVRVPAITKEINAIFGKVQESGTDGTDRTTQFIFVMFCYTAPLSMAAAVGLFSLVVRRLEVWRQSSLQEEDEEDFSMEISKR
jgi:ABC-type polysaccharide transport system permease subunit